jgi:hypothetical protein
MKPQERRRAYGDRDLSDTSLIEEERPESAEQPVAQGQVRRPLASTAQDDQLLLEQEILAITARTPPGPQSFAVMTAKWSRASSRSFMREASVGQTSGATQRCLNPRFSERIGISRPTGSVANWVA